MITKRKQKVRIMKQIFLLFLFSSSLLTAKDKEDLNTLVPDEKIRMINGEFSELKDYVGNGPLLLEFWTTWCPNCPKQMGYLSDICLLYTSPSPRD